VSRDTPPGSIERLLDKAHTGERLTRGETITLLGLQEERQLEALFRAARELRRKHFGEAIFLYGFVYLSTYCRNDCSFCFFRRSNTRCRRYRKDAAEVLEASLRLAESGVNLIDLTLGEDPAVYRETAPRVEALFKAIEGIRRLAGIPVMVSPGAVPEEILRDLAEAGVSWYACYQETDNRDLFARLRPGQDYDTRVERKILAHRLGMLIEEGLLRGVGEGLGDVADSLSLMRLLDADQVRAMSFVAQPGIPLRGKPSATFRDELVSIAVMRLTFPQKLIPASLDVGGLSGLAERLDAGANVVTSLVPPGYGLCGVAASSLDIEDGRRMVDAVVDVLRSKGLEAGSITEYERWLDRRRRRIGASSAPRLPERFSRV